MFQFTTTTVINSAKDSNGTLDKFTGSATGFNVTRVGNFLKDNIKAIYKKDYTPAVTEQATITVPSSGITAGQVLRLVVDVRLTQSTYSEYASTHLYFNKPVVVEVIATATPATDATALVKQLNSIKDRFGASYITATANSAVITLAAKDEFQRIYSAELTVEVTSPNSLIQPEYNVLAGTSFTVTRKGKVGFGDDAYMIRSIMIPTQENTRFFGINAEERPILGGNYTQYTIHYSVDKTFDDGIVAGYKSITNHVFYVKSDLVAAFEAALLSTGLPLNSLTASVADAEMSVSTDATETIVVANAIGTVTYASSDVAVATVSSAGVITAVGAGTADITVTDATGNTAVVTITVVA